MLHQFVYLIESVQVGKLTDGSSSSFPFLSFPFVPPHMELTDHYHYY